MYYLRSDYTDLDEINAWNNRSFMLKLEYLKLVSLWMMSQNLNLVRITFNANGFLNDKMFFECDKLNFQILQWLKVISINNYAVSRTQKRVELFFQQAFSSFFD